MLALQKTLDSSWEIARVSLRQDLDTIQTVLNRRWGQTFGAANLLPASSISGAAALSRVSDTNVILTLGGSPTTALLAATSITASWSGVLAYARGGTNIGTAWTQGSIFFAGATTFLQDNAHLFWDAVNNYLGVRTNTPANAIDVTDTVAGPLGIRVKNLSTAGGNTHASLFVENSTSYGQLFKAGTGYVGYKNIAAGDLGFFNITAGNISTLNDFGNINFAGNGAVAAVFTITGTHAHTAPTAMLGIGGTSATFPGLKRIATAIVARLADDSAAANITADSFIANGGPSGTGGFLCYNAGFFYWSTQSALSSPADGQINITKNSTTTGIGIDVATDAVLKIRNRAQSANAAIVVSTLTASSLTSGKIPIASVGGLLIDGQTPLAGTKVYYVSDTSGGAVTRKLTFQDGILVSET